MRIAVPGRPVPQGSKRHVGHGVMVESGKGLKEWRTDVKQTAIAYGWMPETGPVHVRLDFYFTRPKSHWGTGRNASALKASAPAYPAGKPDVDKLARAVLDALTHVAFNDDSQVVELTARKHYSDELTPPGVVVEVLPL